MATAGEAYQSGTGNQLLHALCVSHGSSGIVLTPWRKRKASADYASASPRMRSILSRVVNEDLCHMMPQIKAPTLLVWGEDDTATPMADAKRMEKLI